jgi:hypothetical protein
VILELIVEAERFPNFILVCLKKENSFRFVKNLNLNQKVVKVYLIRIEEFDYEHKHQPKTLMK